MSAIWGILCAAILFGVFTMLRARDKGCNGNCVGCARDASCKADGVER
ncbi:MAG TPA: hypothetical protein VFD22_04900 [Gemmatimonadaceae bacterium]|jgi:hypothetical protein|nr:hypothetical protein [Gemmatimonadaceae bacterium]